MMTKSPTVFRHPWTNQIHRVENLTHGMYRIFQYLKMKTISVHVYRIYWTPRHSPKQNTPI